MITRRFRRPSIPSFKFRDAARALRMRKWIMTGIFAFTSVPLLLLFQNYSIVELQAKTLSLIERYSPIHRSSQEVARTPASVSESAPHQ